MEHEALQGRREQSFATRHRSRWRPSALNGEYEEYHPFGTTSWWATDGGTEVSAKRYRYTGKERDDETGLGYHGARYYAAWLGRWERPDPAGMVDGPNRYTYCRGGPIHQSDPSGLATSDEENAIGSTRASMASYLSNEQSTWLDELRGTVLRETGLRELRPTPISGITSREAIDALDASRAIGGALPPETVMAVAQMEGIAHDRSWFSGQVKDYVASSPAEARAFFRSDTFYQTVGLDDATEHPPRGAVGDNPAPTMALGSGFAHDQRFKSVVDAATKKGILPPGWEDRLNAAITVVADNAQKNLFHVSARPDYRMHVMTIQAATFAQRYQTAKTALGDMPDLVGVAYIGYNLPAQARERFYDRAGDPTAVEAATQWAFHSQIAPGRDWANLRTPAVTVMYLSKAYERMYRVSGN